MMQYWIKRPIFWMVFCSAIASASFVIERMMQVSPCSLCLIQRELFMGLALCFLISCFMRKTGILSALLFALLGISFSGYQLWLVAHPQLASSCSGDLFFLFQHFPLKTVLSQLFMSNASCAHPPILWGLSLPTWSLFGFILSAWGALKCLRVHHT